MRDSIGIEMLGTPAMFLVTESFKMHASAIAKAVGLESFSIVDIPHPVAGIPPELVHERTSAVIDRIVSSLTATGEQKGEKGKKVVKVEPEVITIRGKSNTEALREVNVRFYQERWTDGFPIVPPTEEAVQWMLMGTDRDPNEVVALVPPAYGKGTIRNIAINCVMAGAKPEYLPVVIAAVEAITDPQFATGEMPWSAFGMQTTTGPVTPLLIVNGPVARDLEIESGRGCFSRGHQANATIGRAVRLILTNTGGAYPGINDMKGQGSSQEFTFCVAEQEEHPVYRQGQNPWQPLHVERGYPRETSTVTAAAAWPPLNIESSKACSPEILDHVVGAISNLAVAPKSLDRQCILILNPTHAGCLVDSGMSKDNIREYLYANAVMPWHLYKKQYPGSTHLQPSWMKYINDESATVHIYRSPKNFDIVVAGGDCPYSQAVRCSYNTATKEIRLPKK